MTKIKLFIVRTKRYTLGLFTGFIAMGIVFSLYSATQSPQPYWFGNLLFYALASCIIVLIQLYALEELLGDDIRESNFNFSFRLGFVAQVATLFVTVGITLIILPVITRFFNLSGDSKLIIYTAIPILVIVLVPVETLIIKSKFG